MSLPPGALLPHQRLPHVEPGMRIGLYGGSFNPPHAGHRLVSMIAMRRLKLDRVWWLVSPGNPLKDHDGLPDTAARCAWARETAASSRIDITAVEEALGVSYTRDTITFLTRRFPQVHFVWLMGADNLASFHRWRGWREIAEAVPFAVIDRPGWTLSAPQSPAAQALARFRMPEIRAATLADSPPPSWTFLHGPRTPLSSTELRARKKATNSQ